MDITITTTTSPTITTVNPVSIKTQSEPWKKESDNLESNVSKDEETLQLPSPAKISIEQDLVTHMITTNIHIKPIVTSKNTDYVTGNKSNTTNKTCNIMSTIITALSNNIASKNNYIQSTHI